MESNNNNIDDSEIELVEDLDGEPMDIEIDGVIGIDVDDSFVDVMHIFTGLLDSLVDPEGRNEDALMNSSLYERNPVKHVITQEEKEKLQIIEYKDAVNKEKYTSCYITQDDFCDEDKIIQLPCEHCFFADSILQWLSEESCECPVCKYKFASVELREIDDVVTVPAIVDWNVQNDYIVPNINRNIFNYNSLNYEYMNDAFIYNPMVHNNYIHIPVDHETTIMDTLRQYYGTINTINTSYFEEDDDEL